MATALHRLGFLNARLVRTMNDRNMSVVSLLMLWESRMNT